MVSQVPEARTPRLRSGQALGPPAKLVAVLIRPEKRKRRCAMTSKGEVAQPAPEVYLDPAIVRLRAVGLRCELSR